jgi:diguanylate cyclase (GGDEF)-like protein/PAS domain S-box-containing protein
LLPASSQTKAFFLFLYSWKSTMRFNTISSILFVSGLICANVMFILWRRRNVRGAKWLCLVMLTMSVWGLAEAFEMAAIAADVKILWAKIGYMGITASTPLLLIFSYHHLSAQSGIELPHDAARQPLLRMRLALLLWFVPLVTTILVWTNDAHHLIWTGYHFVTTGSTEVMVYSHGPWFWVLIIFTYMLLALSIMMLALAAVRLWKFSKQQSLTLLLSIPLPIFANMLYVFFPDQFQGVDLTPVGFAFTGIILTIGIYNFYFLDLTPFARETLMEFLPEAIIVVDSHNIVLDINSAATKMLGKSQKLLIGDNIQPFLTRWLSSQQDNSAGGQYQVIIDQGSGEDHDNEGIEVSKKIFDLCITPFKYKGSYSGHILIFTDITERIANEDLLFETNEKLNAQLVEIHILKDQIEELAVRDALTGLYNRRFLNETLSREFSRAGREHYTICIAMIDVDHFKMYNDTFGHQAGDEVLVTLAKHLVENLREGDVVVRFGGEEFIVLMPFVTIETAENRINGLRASFSKVRHRIDDLKGVTFSAGIASFPHHGSTFDEVLRAADQALYHAKQAGRNQVVILNLETACSDQF